MLAIMATRKESYLPEEGEKPHSAFPLSRRRGKKGKKMNYRCYRFNYLGTKKREEKKKRERFLFRGGGGELATSQSLESHGKGKNGGGIHSHRAEGIWESALD